LEKKKRREELAGTLVIMSELGMKMVGMGAEEEKRHQR
jgi:hypothetical protein